MRTHLFNLQLVLSLAGSGCMGDCICKDGRTFQNSLFLLVDDIFTYFHTAALIFFMLSWRQSAYFGLLGKRPPSSFIKTVSRTLEYSMQDPCSLPGFTRYFGQAIV